MLPGSASAADAGTDGDAGAGPHAHFSYGPWMAVSVFASISAIHR